MRGAVNSYAINGAAPPSWVVLATAAAIATASVAAAAPKRTTYARAHGDATVSITLTSQQRIIGKANGSTDTAGTAIPVTTRSGAANAAAGASGHAIVVRFVPAQAAGDAAATGEALLAQALGAGSAAASAVSVLAKAHIIHPGRTSTTMGAAAVPAAGDVTRYAIAAAHAAASNRVEASTKLAGTNYFLHDGFSESAASATAHVDQGKTAIIATHAAFDAGNSDGGARAFVKHSARSAATGTSSCVRAEMVHTFRPDAQSAATAIGAAYGTRVVKATAAGAAVVGAFTAPAQVRRATKAEGYAAAQMNASAVRVAIGKTLESTATATQVQLVLTGMQQWGEAIEQTGTVSVLTHSNIKRVAGANGIAAVSATARASKVSYALVNDAIATALAGKALAFANSEQRAPEGRYIIVPQEDRTASVPYEERTMVIA